jgi:hypothetical protein
MDEVHLREIRDVELQPALPLPRPPVRPANMLWELRSFVDGHLKKLLTLSGDLPVSVAVCGLYFSRYGLLATVQGMRARQQLSRVLGSSCHLMVLARHAPVSSAH